jgi:hypothetical protein
MKPNIFNYATSELSQDAFICWLIAWADKKNQSIDKRLYNTAICFVQELLGKNNSFVVENIQVGRSFPGIKNIDCWSIVNNKYFLLIEDKKGTVQHSGQLDKYKSAAEIYFKNSDISIMPIYFKMEEQGDYYTIVKKSGFSVFSRNKMLSTLESYVNHSNDKNDIINDYYEKLQELDRKINSYKMLPIKDWDWWYSWQGFYFELQKHLKGEWNYVPNASRGFLGFRWHHKHTSINGEKFGFYLQLEYNKLVFKLYECSPNKRHEIRKLLRKFLYLKANELNIPIKQFGRIGNYMSVVILIGDYRIIDENGILDFFGTLEKLKQNMNLLDEVEKEIKNNI